MVNIGIIGNTTSKELLDYYTNDISIGIKTAYLNDAQDNSAELEAECFDIMIVNCKTDFMHKYTSRLGKEPILIINSDHKDIFKTICIKKGTLITYGFNGRACVTASSVTDNEVQVCIQRTFKTISGKTVDEQEFSVKFTQTNKIHELLGAVIAALICDVEAAQIKSLDNFWTSKNPPAF